MNSEPVDFVREEEQQQIINSILKKIDAIEKSDSELGGRLVTLSFEELTQIIQPEEANLIEILLSVDPKRLGFKGKHLGILPVPNDLVKITNQVVTINGEETKLAPQFVPRNVFVGFEKLNHSMTRDINHVLYIESGYRSPAYQIITLLHYLKLYDFDLLKTAARVAFPGYSEHGFPPLQAVDFIAKVDTATIDSPFEFENSVEFSWLVDHANDYGFYLSYPRDNSDGIMYEPWHWRFDGL